MNVRGITNYNSSVSQSNNNQINYFDRPNEGKGGDK